MPGRKQDMAAESSPDKPDRIGQWLNDVAARATLWLEQHWTLAAVIAWLLVQLFELRF